MSSICSDFDIITRQQRVTRSQVTCRFGSAADQLLY
jgi:hypothetical protein